MHKMLSLFCLACVCEQMFSVKNISTKIGQHFIAAKLTLNFSALAQKKTDDAISPSIEIGFLC